MCFSVLYSTNLVLTEEIDVVTNQTLVDYVAA